LLTGLLLLAGDLYVFAVVDVLHGGPLGLGDLVGRRGVGRLGVLAKHVSEGPKAGEDVHFQHRGACIRNTLKHTRTKSRLLQKKTMSVLTLHLKKKGSKIQGIISKDIHKKKEYSSRHIPTIHILHMP